MIIMDVSVKCLDGYHMTVTETYSQPFLPLLFERKRHGSGLCLSKLKLCGYFTFPNQVSFLLPPYWSNG